MPRPPAVTLSEEEQRTLETFVHRGKANARTLTRARILLKSAEGWSTRSLPSPSMCVRRRSRMCDGRFAEGGREGVL